LRQGDWREGEELSAVTEWLTSNYSVEFLKAKSSA
jgi:hypothetical protein